MKSFKSFIAEDYRESQKSGRPSILQYSKENHVKAAKWHESQAAHNVDSLKYAEDDEERNIRINNMRHHRNMMNTHRKAAHTFKEAVDHLAIAGLHQNAIEKLHRQLYQSDNDEERSSIQDLIDKHHSHKKYHIKKNFEGRVSEDYTKATKHGYVLFDSNSDLPAHRQPSKEAHVAAAKWHREKEGDMHQKATSYHLSKISDKPLYKIQ